jgi:hypothetical protein
VSDREVLVWTIENVFPVVEAPVMVYPSAEAPVTVTCPTPVPSSDAATPSSEAVEQLV